MNQNHDFVIVGGGRRVAAGRGAPGSGIAPATGMRTAASVNGTTGDRS